MQINIILKYVIGKLNIKFGRFSMGQLYCINIILKTQKSFENYIYTIHVYIHMIILFIQRNI